jgi:hypothetical protein
MWSEQESIRDEGRGSEVEIDALPFKETGTCGFGDDVHRSCETFQRFFCSIHFLVPVFRNLNQSANNLLFH